MNSSWNHARLTLVRRASARAFVSLATLAIAADVGTACSSDNGSSGQGAGGSSGSKADAGESGGTKSTGGALSTGGGKATGGTSSGGATQTGGTSGGPESGGSVSDGGSKNGTGGSGGGTESGDSGTDSGSSGTAGTGGAPPTCGGLGQACCTSAASCSPAADLTCLNGASCSCVKKVVGNYVIRVDGAVLLEQSPSAGTVQSPVLVASTASPLTAAVDVAEGFANDTGGHGCAALSNGTVWCWRTAATGNSNGQLGNGTADTSGAILRATQVLKAANTPLTDVKAMAASNGPATCAVTNDNKLYCWGALTWVVNNGTFLSSAYAQPITTDGATVLTGVLQASIGSTDACAILKGTSANEVWCWGYNGGYGLGLGDTTNRRYPTNVPGVTNPTKVAVTETGYLNQNTTCVLDGSNVRCWGYNGNGQAGVANLNSPVMSPSLVKIQGGATFDGALDLAPGMTNFCTLHAGDALWCWGASYKEYATSYGAANVVGNAGNTGDYSQNEPHYLTSDGVYHLGTSSRTPTCGVLQ